MLCPLHVFRLDVVDNVLRLPRINPAVVADPVAAPPPAPFPAETCGTSCSAAFVTPGVLAAQYNLGTPPATPAANSSMSVSEFQGQMWDQANCDEFAEVVGIIIGSLTHIFLALPQWYQA